MGHAYKYVSMAPHGTQTPERVEGLHSRSNGRFHVLYGVFEHPQALSFARPRAAGPSGVLNGIDKSLRVRHEAKYQPARIADARDVVDAAIRVVGRLPIG